MSLNSTKFNKSTCVTARGAVPKILSGACLIFLGILCNPSPAKAAFGIYESYVIIGGVYYDLYADTGNPNFSGNFFGTFQTNGTLTFNGGEIKTFKENQTNCNGGNVCIGNIYWVIKQGTNTVNSGSAVLSFDADLNINGCSQNQKWDEIGGTTNLISGLAAGSYSLEVYCDATGDQDSNSGCDDVVTQAALTATFEVQSALPVDFVDFYANKNSTSAKLLWATASETNNAHFEVQRSSDNGVWEKLGQVTGYGNSYERRDYQFIDSRPLVGMNHYRLKQVDFDGRFEYSKVVSVGFGREQALHIYPNPVNDALFLGRLENTDEQKTAFIFDVNGRLMFQQKINGEYKINVDALLPGIYFLTIKNETGTYHLHERFVKK